MVYLSIHVVVVSKGTKRRAVNAPIFFNLDLSSFFAFFNFDLYCTFNVYVRSHIVFGFPKEGTRPQLLPSYEAVRYSRFNTQRGTKKQPVKYYFSMGKIQLIYDVFIKDSDGKGANTFEEYCLYATTMVYCLYALVHESLTYHIIYRYVGTLVNNLKVK
jgi:hypothetical protein